MFDFVIGGDNFCSVAVDDVTDDVIDGSETMPWMLSSLNYPEGKSMDICRTYKEQDINGMASKIQRA